MAFEGNGNAVPFTSALAIAENLFVMHDSTNGVRNVKLATAGAQIFGITVTKTATTNDNVAVRQWGQAYLIVNGNSQNIAAQDRLKATTDGIGIQAATDLDEYGAIAMEAATTDGVKILVDISRGTLSVS